MAQVAQPPAEQEKQRDAHDDEDDLLGQIVRRARRADLEPERAQEKRDRLDLEARAVHRAHEHVAEPLREREGCKRHQNAQQVRAVGRGHELQRQQQLKHRQEKQRAAGGDLPSGDRAALLLHGAALFAHVGELEHVRRAAENVAAEHLRRLGDLFAVEVHAAAAAQVADGPLTGVVAHEHGVDVGHVGIGQRDVRAAGAADQALPVQQRIDLAVRRDEMAPGLRLGAAVEHGRDTADEHDERDDRQNEVRGLRGIGSYGRHGVRLLSKAPARGAVHL